MKNDLSKILVRPHITEKATMSSESSVYVFEVLKSATKNMISDAFEEKYKVSPVRVSTVTLPAKKVFVRGKRGLRPGCKKAYIYVKKGEKVEIM